MEYKLDWAIGISAIGVLIFIFFELYYLSAFCFVFFIVGLFLNYKKVKKRKNELE